MSSRFSHRHGGRRSRQDPVRPGDRGGGGEKADVLAAALQQRTVGLLCVSPFSQTKRDRPNGSQLPVGSSEPAGTSSECEQLQVKAAIDYYIGRHPDSTWIDFKHGQSWRTAGWIFSRTFSTSQQRRLIVGLQLVQTYVRLRTHRPRRLTRFSAQKEGSCVSVKRLHQCRSREFMCSFDRTSPYVPVCVSASAADQLKLLNE